MAWIIAAIVGVAIGAFVMVAEVVTYFLCRERFSHITFGCGILGVVLSISGIVDSLMTPAGFI